jgi:hypothetical protein
MVPAGSGSAPGWIFTYGGSSGSDQTTLRLAVNHRLILMSQKYPAGKVLAPYAEMPPSQVRTGAACGRRRTAHRPLPTRGRHLATVFPARLAPHETGWAGSLGPGPSVAVARVAGEPQHPGQASAGQQVPAEHGYLRQGPVPAVRAGGRPDADHGATAGGIAERHLAQIKDQPGRPRAAAKACSRSSPAVRYSISPVACTTVDLPASSAGITAAVMVLARSAPARAATADLALTGDRRRPILTPTRRRTQIDLFGAALTAFWQAETGEQIGGSVRVRQEQGQSPRATSHRRGQTAGSLNTWVIRVGAVQAAPCAGSCGSSLRG